MQKVLRMGMSVPSKAQALINAALRRAEASKWAPGARAGVRMPRLVHYPTARDQPLTQVRAPIPFERRMLRARYLIDL